MVPVGRSNTLNPELLLPRLRPCLVRQSPQISQMFEFGLPFHFVRELPSYDLFDCCNARYGSAAIHPKKATTLAKSFDSRNVFFLLVLLLRRH